MVWLSDLIRKQLGHRIGIFSHTFRLLLKNSSQFHWRTYVLIVIQMETVHSSKYKAHILNSFIPAKLLASSSRGKALTRKHFWENTFAKIFPLTTFEFSIAADALLNHQLTWIRRHNRQRWYGEGAAQETRRPNENEPLQYLNFERAWSRASLEHGSEFCSWHHRARFRGTVEGNLRQVNYDYWNSAEKHAQKNWIWVPNTFFGITFLSLIHNIKN